MKPILSLLVLCLAAPVRADAPEVIAAEATKSGMAWRISVTMRHTDTGWDHFADAWNVTDENGTVLAERELMHPHVMEQPFTRSLSAVSVPDGTRTLFIRAHCSKDGWTGPLFEIDLTPGY